MDELRPEVDDGGNPPSPTPAWPPSASPPKPIGRRVVLGMLGLGAVGVVAGSTIQRGVDTALRPVTANDPTGLSSFLPGGDYFEIYTVTSGYPTADPATYRLAVDGRVATPLTLSIDDLKAMPATTLIKDFQCVTGWRVPGVHWQGVTLAAVLDRAGVAPSGTALRFESFDGLYTESLTMDQARRPDVIVAYSMLGGAVSREHGGPVRLYVAPMYGYKSCKWLSRITVTNKVEPGYWETQGNYDVNAWVGGSNGRNDPATG